MCADVGLAGDSRAVLKSLLPLLQRKRDRRFLETAQKRMAKWRELMNERGTRRDKPMKPQVVTYHLNKLLENDAIISADSGTIATWAARYIDIRSDMKFSLSGTLATMANGLPYCIGAAGPFSAAVRPWWTPLSIRTNHHCQDASSSSRPSTLLKR